MEQKTSRLITGVICLAVILGTLLAVFCFSPFSPLKEPLAGSFPGERIPAHGFWGSLGFWRNFTDNRDTLFLVVLFCTLAIVKTIRTFFMKKTKKND